MMAKAFDDIAVNSEKVGLNDKQYFGGIVVQCLCPFKEKYVTVFQVCLIASPNLSLRSDSMEKWKNRSANSARFFEQFVISTKFEEDIDFFVTGFNRAEGLISFEYLLGQCETSKTQVVKTTSAVYNTLQWVSLRARLSRGNRFRYYTVKKQFETGVRAKWLHGSKNTSYCLGQYFFIPSENVHHRKIRRN